MSVASLRYPPSQAVDQLKVQQAGITAYLAGIKAVKEQGLLGPPPGMGAAAQGPASPIAMPGGGAPPGLSGVPPLPLPPPPGIGAGGGVAQGLPPLPPGMPQAGGVGAGSAGALAAPTAPPMPPTGMGMGAPGGGLPSLPQLPPRPQMMAFGGVVSGQPPMAAPADESIDDLPPPLTAEEMFLAMMIAEKEQPGGVERLAAGGMIDMPAPAPAQKKGPRMTAPAWFAERLLTSAPDDGGVVGDLVSAFEHGAEPGELWGIVRDMMADPQTRPEVESLMKRPQKVA